MVDFVLYFIFLDHRLVLFGMIFTSFCKFCNDEQGWCNCAKKTIIYQYAKLVPKFADIMVYKEITVQQSKVIFEKDEKCLVFI